MKLIFKPYIFIITLINMPHMSHGQDIATLNPTLSSTRSQAALLIYTLLKLTKKTATIKELDDYYDFLRTTEQGALHYGISAALTESITQNSSQATLSTATLDASGYVATSWIIRSICDAFLETRIGISLQKALQDSKTIPTGSEELCKEAVMCVLSTMTYNTIKRWIPLLAQA